MTLRDLEYLVALGELKHFRKAADACNVSQPTLSGQLKRMEDELGTKLLERTSRKVIFTQVGLILVEQAKEVLKTYQIFKEMASRQGEDMSGPLHIGVIPTVAPYLLPHVVRLLHETYPKLELYLHEAQTEVIVSQLNSGQLDCAILAKVKETEPYIELPVYDERMLLALPSDHKLADKPVVKLPELKDESLLTLEDGHCLSNQVVGYCLQAGINDNKRFRASSLETLRSMIAIGHGISLFPELSTPDVHEQNGISYVPCVDPIPVRTIALIYRPGSPLRPCYEAVAKCIRTHMTDVIKQKESLLQFGS